MKCGLRCFLLVFLGAFRYAFADDFCQGYGAIGTIHLSPSTIEAMARGTWLNPGGHSGRDNLEVIGVGADQYLRVHFPKGSFDPGSMRRLGRPIGGANFFIPFPGGGAECVVLDYKVRFSSDFQFVKGGKLLGLYGGKGNSGGHAPNGYDGFSFRSIWKESGALAVYSYVPGVEKWGFGGNVSNFNFSRNGWESISLSVRLNSPSKSDGHIRLQAGADSFYLKTDALIRKTGDLRIDGVFFSTFFGGNNEDFATPIDSYIDFYHIRVEGYK